MSTIHQCDKCQRQGQVLTVLGKDICVAHCVPKLREWLEVKSSKRLPPVERFALVHKLCVRNGFVTGRMIADLTGERVETANEGLRVLLVGGRLQRAARGKYTLPIAEAAE